MLRKKKPLSLGLKCERFPVRESLFGAVPRNIEEEAEAGVEFVRLTSDIKP